MKTWKKGSNNPLSTNFTESEMECQCRYDSCDIQTMDERLLEKLQKVRDRFGKPLKVTSAFRCEKHQNDLRKTGIKTAMSRSQHELGMAVDIRPLDFSKEEMERLFPILSEEFKAIGISPRFFHVDMRSDRIRRWDY